MIGMNQYRNELFARLLIEAQEQGLGQYRRNKLLLEVSQGKWDNYYTDIVSLIKY